MNTQKKVIIIGSGIGGLATACILGKAGYSVEVFEKNEQLGGRLSVLEQDGFRFDMGPSWYLMPDVFEHFFKLIGEKVEDHLTLIPLAPSYRIFFKDEVIPNMQTTPDGSTSIIDMYADIEKTVATLDQIEPGAGEKFRDYLKRSEYQYGVAIDRFMYKNYSSVFDFLTWEMAKEGSKLSVFTKMNTYVSRFFAHDAIKKIMQYTLVFLGSSPYNTPALYNIMTHVDFNGGVFYPQGGMNEIVKALVNIGKKHGVVYHVNTPVSQIQTKDGHATSITLENGTSHTADIVVSNGDIHHTEMKLLAEADRSYTETYWDTRVLAPSALIMYLGVDGNIPSLTHHNLLFAKDWKKGFAEIFNTPLWPSDPSLYVCAPSKTDPSVAPRGKENLFVLVPIASNLDYTQDELDAKTDQYLDLVAKYMNIPNLKERIITKKLFCVKDFKERYNSLGGTALGLAHTMRQTACFRPDTISKKIDNLYYVGGNTNPGIGVPICLISAELVYKRLIGENTGHPLPTPITGTK